MKHIMWKWTLVVWMGLLAAVPAIGADTKISAEPAASALDGTELLPCVQSATNKKCTTAQVKTLANTSAVRATTTTSEALANSDQGKLVTFSNASPVACTIAQASSGGNFVAGWVASLKNLGAGTVTCTPTTSTVDGAASFTLTQGQGVDLYSDGTNYFTQPGKGAAGANPSATAGPTAINGSAQTFMRSDGAPAVQQGSSSQKGIVQVDNTSIESNSGVIGIKGLTGDCVTASGSVATACSGAHPGYIANSYYSPIGVGTVATGNAIGANAIHCAYGVIPQKVTLSALALRIATASPGGNVQLAIYQNSSGRPGAKIDSTGSQSTTSTGTFALNLGANRQVGPGGTDGGRDVWFCVNADNGTVAFTAYAATFPNWYLGSTNIGSVITTNGIITSISCAGANCNGGSSTFNTWPSTLSGSTWSDDSTLLMPAIAFKVASFP